MSLASKVELTLGTWAAAFGVSKDVLRRVFSEQNVESCGKRGPYPVYAASDAIPGWVKHLTGGEAVDPDSLRPFERKAHYQAEHEKLRLQVERGELVPSIEVERGHGQIFAITTHGLDTLPDVLERDVGLSPLQLTRVEKHIDEMREALYQALIEGTEDDGADSAVQDRA